MTTTDDAAPVAGGVSESDIAAILTAANEGEIAQGQAASGRATRDDVRVFAQMMVTDHTAANTRAAGVFSRAGITPTENEITRALRENSQRTVTNLATYRGAEYDRVYIRTQVDLHRWLLTAIDTAMLPSARTPELRTLLTDMRGSVATHLERAQALQR